MAPEDWLTREREYAKSFWAPSVQARCIKWKASLQGQMKQAKAAFAEEMNGMFDAIDQRYGEKEGERLRANLEPIVIDTYALIKSLIRSIDEHHLSNERSIDGQHPSNEKSILQLGTPAHSRPSSPAREAATVISMAETKPPSDPTEQPMTTQKRQADTSPPTGPPEKKVKRDWVRSGDLPEEMHLKRREIEGRAWLFCHPGLGDGYFVLRCGTADKPFYFVRDPFSYNRVIRHFAADRDCHDVRTTERLSLHEVLEKFAYKVDDADGDFANENHARIDSVHTVNKHKAEASEGQGPGRRCKLSLRREAGPATSLPSDVLARVP